MPASQSIATVSTVGRGTFTLGFLRDGRRLSLMTKTWLIALISPSISNRLHHPGKAGKFPPYFFRLPIKGEIEELHGTGERFKV